MANTVICLASDHGKAHDPSWNQPGFHSRLWLLEIRSESLAGRSEITMLIDRQADAQEQSNLAGSPGMAGVEAELKARLLERLFATKVTQTTSVVQSGGKRLARGADGKLARFDFSSRSPR